MRAEEHDIAALKEVIRDYFDGLHFSDVSRLERVFHHSAIYACATDGSLLYRTMGEYFPVVAARPSPASQGEERTDRIVSVEFAGPVTARAVLACSMAGKAYTDWLTFVKLDGRWQVISKVFHYEAREAA